MKDSREFRRRFTGTVIAIGLLLGGAGCASSNESANPTDSPSASGGTTTTQTAGPSSATPSAVASGSAPTATRSALRSRSDQVLTKLAAKDYRALAKLVDSAKGLRFSPYAYIDVAQGVVLTRSQVAGLGSSTKRFVWGSDAGSGEPIKLTFAAYNKRFGYSQDFLHAPQVAENKTLGEGSALHNTAKVFPSGQFVDYHFPGFDPQFDGLDWETLRVVMRKQSGTWYAVGLVHNSWTP